ncbi:MAG: hypothetical protein ABJB16_07325 [Saprospiraceae bacterium]
MNLLPFKNFSFSSKLNASEITDRLLAITEAEKFIRIPLFNDAETKMYEGQITDQNFSIRRLIKYRNSFLPRIKGEIKAVGNGTRIDVRMRLHVVIIIFVIFWCTMVGIGCFVFILLSIRDGRINPFILVPFMMLIVGYGVTVVAFNYECNKAKLDLEQIFQASAIE